jgi:hypothetical protein
MMEGAGNVLTGKGPKTFRAQSQSGLLCAAFHWPLLISGKPIAMKDISACRKLETFAEQEELVEKLGFELFVKRAKIGNNKHIRVRPRFSKWSASGEIMITDPQITIAVLEKILSEAGTYKGLGDWRPGSRTPGPWGMFSAKIVG